MLTADLVQAPQIFQYLKSYDAFLKDNLASAEALFWMIFRPSLCLYFARKYHFISKYCISEYCGSSEYCVLFEG